MDAASPKSFPLLSYKSLILLALVAVGVTAALYRFATSLGEATNLNDNYPWGLWIAFDVLIGVALAAGGFAITAVVYVFKLEKYRPVVKPAVLTAFLGYLMVILGLIVDIGKPLSFWHPVVMWQPHSVLFEIMWCIILYTSVLALEFAPPLLERFGMPRLSKFLTRKIIVFPLVIAGVTLSYLHQSSLGALFLIAPTKLHGLWYTPLIPQLFFLSAIAVGLAMVTIESILSTRFFRLEKHPEILSGLSRGTAIALLVYLVVRVADLIFRGNLGLALEGSRASFLFLLELGVGVLLPMILLSSKAYRRSTPRILVAQLLVIAGIVLNRLNVNFLTQASHGGFYTPSLTEILVTLGLVSLGVFLYRLAALRLRIF